MAPKMLPINPPPPTYVDRAYPPALELIVLRTLEEKPEKRYATAGELFEELEGYLVASGARTRNHQMAQYLHDRRAIQVAGLVSEISDTRTTVTLVNLNPSVPRTVVVQGGGYAEHQFVSVTAGGVTTPINGRVLTVELDPGSGQSLVLEMKRYANRPSALHPWQRPEGR